MYILVDAICMCVKMELTTLTIQVCWIEYISIQRLKSETYVAWSLGWPVPLVCVSAGVWAGELHGDRGGEGGRQRRRVSTAGEKKKLQRWSSELLKLPYCFLLSSDQWSICLVRINNHTREPDWHEEDLHSLAPNTSSHFPLLLCFFWS